MSPPVQPSRTFRVGLRERREMFRTANRPLWSDKTKPDGVNRSRLVASGHDVVVGAGSTATTGRSRSV